MILNTMKFKNYRKISIILWLSVIFVFYLGFYQVLIFNDYLLFSI